MNRDELRTAIRQRADMVGSLFVTDEELDLMIDMSVADLYDLLTTQYGDEYFAKHTWIQVTPGTDPSIAWPRFEDSPTGLIPGPDNGYPSCYALPNDFVRLVRVQFYKGTVTQNGVKVGTETFYATQNELNWRLNTTDKRAYPMHRLDTAGQLIDMTPCDWNQTNVGYRLRHGPMQQLAQNGTLPNGTLLYAVIEHDGVGIDFLPVPRSQYAVQITYVPAPQLLPNQPFPEYIIFDCAALCVEKQRSDSSTLRALQDRVRNRITQYSRTPDAANPPRVVDVYGGNRILGRTRGEPWDL